MIRVSKAHNELKREAKQLRTELFETSVQLDEAKALRHQLELRDEKIEQLERALKVRGRSLSYGRSVRRILRQ